MASVYLRVRHFSFVAAAAALFLLTPVARAQYASPPQDYPAPDVDAREWADDEIPAHLAIVDGDVTLERDGRREAAVENIVLLAGDRLRTMRGRAEVLYADGSALDLDYDSTVDLLSDSLVRLTQGRIRLSIARGTNALDYRVDTPAGSAFIRTAGDYRLTLASRGSEPELDLAVLHGSAELANDYGRTIVRAGTHAFASVRSAPSLPYPANSASWDDFDRWVDDQHGARLGYGSVRYLPSELRYYGGAFDRYGSWGYEPAYGQVWYPAVDSGWRPYSHGRWSFVGVFGWTWVGFDRWSWATHHYGRWGFRNRWYWIPHRRWSPAWVSWAYAPGYVSWCPLGWDGRPVISITNVYVNRVDPWIAWTVVPARSFAPNVAVARYVVARETLAPAVWSRFAVQRTAPVSPANLPLRAARPLRAPTASRSGYAIPRDGIVGGIGDRESLRPSTAGAPPSRAGAASRVPSPVTAPAGTGVRGAEIPGTGTRTASPRVQPRAAQPPRDGVPTPNTAPSRLNQPRDPAAQTPRESTSSPWMRARPPAQAAPDRESPPSRTIRPREPASQPPRESPSSPWMRTRPPAQDAPERESPPSRAIRSREPASQPPRASEPPASRAPAPSPWIRSRPSEPERGPAPSRVAPSRERQSEPPPSSRPSGGGWGSGPARSRVAPGGGGNAPSGPPAAQPSRGGSRSPSSSAPASGGSRGQAVRRGGGS